MAGAARRRPPQGRRRRGSGRMLGQRNRRAARTAPVRAQRATRSRRRPGRRRRRGPLAAGSQHRPSRRQPSRSPLLRRTPRGRTCVGQDPATQRLPRSRRRRMNAAQPMPEWAPPDHPASWEADPVPLGAHRLLPEFPIEALPGWLAEYVAAVTDATQTPPDLPGCVALACLSAACGGKALVVPRPGWEEPVNIYTVVALPPGSRKTAVFRALTTPLLAAEKQLVDVAKGMRIEAEMAARVARAQAEDSARAAEKSGKADAVAEATAAMIDADSLTVPPVPQLVAGNETPESASALLAAQGGRLAVLSAEGGVFNDLAGRYSNKPNLDLFLKGHGGDVLRTGRIGRDAEYVERPALTLGVTLQPQLLRQLATMPGFRDSGVLARILYALPENTVGRRKIDTPPPPAETTQAYAETLQALVLSLYELPEPIQLTLTADARAALRQLEEWLEPQLDSTTGRLHAITDWAAKLAGATLRLAGMLHLAAHIRSGYDQPISSATFRAAARLGHYYLAQALAVFDLMGADSDLEDARHVLAWITRTRSREFTRRDLFYAVRGKTRFAKVTDLDPALVLLTEHGHIRHKPAEPNPKGGRPSAVYEVHPALTESTEPTKPRSSVGSVGFVHATPRPTADEEYPQ
ncbi:MAG: DUF3987 domain-containing protein [Propionibacteriales bacterium]|nr:DUF3987 domain-containing protein [Propionibacteriales bacterium]